MREGRLACRRPSGFGAAVRVVVRRHPWASAAAQKSTHSDQPLLRATQMAGATSCKVAKTLVEITVRTGKLSVDHVRKMFARLVSADRIRFATF